MKKVKAVPLKADFIYWVIWTIFQEHPVGRGYPPVIGFYFLRLLKILANWESLWLTTTPSACCIEPYTAYVLANLSDPAISIHLKLLTWILSPILSYILSSISRWLLLEVRFIPVADVVLFFSITANQYIRIEFGKNRC